MNTKAPESMQAESAISHEIEELHEVEVYLNKLMDSTLNQAGGEKLVDVASVLIEDIQDLSLKLEEFAAAKEGHTVSKESLNKAQQISPVNGKDEGSPLHIQALNVFAQFTAVLSSSSAVLASVPVANHMGVVASLDILQGVMSDLKVESHLSQGHMGFLLASMALEGSQGESGHGGAEHLNLADSLTWQAAVAQAKAERAEVVEEFVEANPEVAEELWLGEEAAPSGEVVPEQGPEIVSHVEEAAAEAEGVVPAVEVQQMKAQAPGVEAPESITRSVGEDQTQAGVTDDGGQGDGVRTINAQEDLGWSYDASLMFGGFGGGGSVTFSATMQGGGTLPGWLSFDPETGVFSGVPLNEDVGSLVIEVTATGAQGDEVTSVSNAFEISVANTNDAPTVAPIGQQVLLEDEAWTFDVSGRFSDVDAGDSLSFSAIQVGGAPLPSWLSFDPQTGVFSGTPDNGDVGVVRVKVTATDESGASVSDSFIIRVVNTNDAPTVTPIDDGFANEDAEWTYDVSGQFADADAGDSLTYTATLVGGAPLPAWLTLSAVTGVFTGSPANGDVGVFAVEVTATDSQGASVSDVFQVTVNNVNDAPLVSPLGGGVTVEGETFIQDVGSNFEDIDVGDILMFSLGGSAPSWVTIDSSTGVITANPGAGDAGVYNFQVFATDTSDASVSDNFTLSVGDGGSGGGSSNPDILEGDLGIDFLFGFENEDIIIGDAMVGQTLEGVTGAMDTLSGGNDGDFVFGDAGSGLRNSIGGSDFIYGENGSDTLVGDTGNVGDADFTESSIGGNDSIFGGNDMDFIVGDAYGSIDQASIGGNDSIQGDKGNDVIYGDAYEKILNGSQGGNDIIYGGEGSDIIIGDASDILDTSSGGNDQIYGGKGNDTIYGDTDGGDNGQGGNDYIDGGSGSDIIYANSGDDVVIYDGLDSTVDGGEGYDVLKIFELNADLDNFPAINFEEIDIGNLMQNNLTLSEEDVLDISSQGMLIIEGDGLDNVELTGNWLAGLDNGDYTTYTSGAAVLEIDNDIVDDGGVSII